MELICSTALILISLTLIIKWHSVVAEHRINALKKIDMVTKALSFIDRLKIDEQLRQQGHMKTPDYDYSWLVKSIAFEKADEYFGACTTKEFFPIIDLKVTWKNSKGIEQHMVFQRPLA